MEVEDFGGPLDVEDLGEAFGFFFWVGDECCVVGFVDCEALVFLFEFAPCLHESVVVVVELGDPGEVCGLGVWLGEGLCVVGEAGVDGVAVGVDDGASWENLWEEGEDVVVLGLFVGDVAGGLVWFGLGEFFVAGERVLCEGVDVVLGVAVCREGHGEGVEGVVWIELLLDGGDGLEEGGLLVGGGDVWELGEDLFEEGGSGAHHAEDEDEVFAGELCAGLGGVGVG